MKNKILNCTCSFFAVSLLEIIPLSSFWFLWLLITSIILFSKLPFIITCKEKISWYTLWKFLRHANALHDQGRNNAEIPLPFKFQYFKFSVSGLNISYKKDTSSSASYTLSLEIEEFIPYYQESQFTF